MWVWQCITADQLMKTTIYSNTTVTLHALGDLYHSPSSHSLYAITNLPEAPSRYYAITSLLEAY